jgi:hypothetical protein
MIVELERFTDLHVVELGPGALLDDDGIGNAQILDFALDHFRGPADERVAVDAQKLARLELAVRQLDRGAGREERLSPGDARDRPHAQQRLLIERPNLADVARVRVGDPELGLGDVLQKARGAQQQPEKDRALLRDQQHGERQPQPQSEELGLVAEQHLQPDPQHWELS